nr:unnamed protein product [Spirometra erinaceieuropaei]
MKKKKTGDRGFFFKVRHSLTDTGDATHPEPDTGCQLSNSSRENRHCHPSPSSFSSPFSFPTTSKSAVVASAMHINITHNPDTPTNTNITTVDTIAEDLVYACPHGDCPLTSHVNLVSPLPIHRTETGEPVPGAPTCIRRTYLHCLHCLRTFMHRMDLFNHMHI